MRFSCNSASVAVNTLDTISRPEYSNIAHLSCPHTKSPEHVDLFRLFSVLKWPVPANFSTVARSGMIFLADM
jgi:hypothetical protein